MTLVKDFDYYDVETEPHPEIQRRYRLQLWLQILLPLLLGMAVILAIALYISRIGFGSASAWADTLLALMVIPFLVVGLLPLAAIAALAYGAGWLTGNLSPPFRRIRVAVFRAAITAQRAADLAAEPFLRIGAGKAAAQEALENVVELVRPARDDWEGLE